MERIGSPIGNPLENQKEGRNGKISAWIRIRAFSNNHSFNLSCSEREIKWFSVSTTSTMNSGRELISSWSSPIIPQQSMCNSRNWRHRLMAANISLKWKILVTCCHLIRKSRRFVANGKALHNDFKNCVSSSMCFPDRISVSSCLQRPNIYIISHVSNFLSNF